MKTYTIRIPVFFTALLLFGSGYSQTLPPKHEFRAVWVATVTNIDWPSKPELSSQEQQKEFLDIIKLHQENGMNALVVQVRPAADAFYPSRYEPWSKWLTGKLGKAPQPYYDPLEFMIAESHKAGLEFHAWFNPYRGVFNVDTLNIDSASVAFQHPEWFLKYGKNLYFDPGIPEAREHVVNVVLDVVNRYDIDGVHFDDYFYPYKIARLNFPDTASFARYGKAFSNIDDWRRENVNVLIKEISDSMRQVKPFVKFGISPFGVWRNQDKDPKGSATRAGQTCYDDLYADVLKWVREGWIDYVTPQIYWTIGFAAAPHDVIAKWWSANSNIPVYIGHGAYRINSENADTKWKDPTQVPSQIRLSRSLNNVKGSVFFSAKSFIRNPLGFNDSLKNTLYKYPALIPAMHDSVFNQQFPLSFLSDQNSITLQWKETRSGNSMSPHRRYVIYRFNEGEKIELNDPSKILAVVSNTNPYASGTQHYRDETVKLKKKYVYIVTGVNRYQAESKALLAYPVKNYKKYWKTYTPVGL